MRKLKLFDKVALITTIFIVSILIWGSILRYWTIFPKENKPNENIIAIIESGDCLMCHSKEVQNRSALNHFFLGKYYEKRQKQATSFFVIDTMYRDIKQTGIASQVDLSRIENVTISNRMPPHAHTLLSLNSYINISKKNELTNWIYDVRSNCYATIDVTDNMRGEPLQPIISYPDSTYKHEYSRFDKYLLGNTRALLEAEILGYQYFKEHNCTTCHIGSDVGGLGYAHIASYDTFSSHGKIIRRISDDTPNNASSVRYNIPSLRNIAEKHIFFHDSSAQTLREAVSIMVGLQATPNKIPDNQLDMIVLFLNTLSTEETTAN